MKSATKGQKFQYEGDNYGTQYYEVTGAPIKKTTHFDSALFIPCVHVCIGNTPHTSFRRNVHLDIRRFSNLKALQA